MGFMEQLNEFYKDLDSRADKIKEVLEKNGFTVLKGFFNGQYNRDEDGNFVKDYFPLPVLRVEEVCDIEIDATHINVSTKTLKQNAENLNYDLFGDYYFEVYGVNDYLADYYKSGEELSKLHESLDACDEEEIGFAFSFANDTEPEKLNELLTILRDNGFIY